MPIAFETIPAFSTPILLVDVPDAAAMNAELADALLAREKEQSSKSHSTLGGWQSTWDIDSWAGAGATRLLAIGSTIANRATVDRDGKPVSIDWRWNMWANINRHGHGNELHSHPGSFWSGATTSTMAAPSTIRRWVANSNSWTRARRGPRCMPHTSPLRYRAACRLARRRPCNPRPAGWSCSLPGCCIKCGPIVAVPDAFPLPSISACERDSSTNGLPSLMPEWGQRQ